MVYLTDVKASFSDKLGTIGGTFGIFLGISFLGIYEVIIDIILSLKERYSKRVIIKHV